MDSLNEIASRTQQIRRLIDRERDRHTSQMCSLKFELEQLQAECPHPKTTPHLDVADMSSSFDECTICGNRSPITQ